MKGAALEGNDKLIAFDGFSVGFAKVALVNDGGVVPFAQFTANIQP